MRVLADVGRADCQAAWSALVASVAALGNLNEDFELVPDAWLRVQPDAASGSADLCSPPVAGGYLGAENQAIRVQLVDSSHFTWGLNNGTQPKNARRAVVL